MKREAKRRIKKLKERAENIERLYMRSMAMAAKHSRELGKIYYRIDTLTSKSA